MNVNNDGDVNTNGNNVNNDNVGVRPALPLCQKQLLSRIVRALGKGIRFHPAGWRENT